MRKMHAGNADTDAYYDATNLNTGDNDADICIRLVSLCCNSL